MSLLSFFKSLSPNGDSKSLKIGILENEIKKSFPELEGEEVVKYTCISGLLCRVAFVDLTSQVKRIRQFNKS